MTNTDSRAFIRGLLNQTSNTNTQFTDTDIDEAVSVARRAFATILPEEILPNPCFSNAFLLNLRPQPSGHSTKSVSPGIDSSISSSLMGFS